MRKVAVICTALLFTAGSAWAGAKDKSSNTLVDISGVAAVINNTTVKTATKSKDCTLQLQAKPVTLADGDVVICIAEADVVSSLFAPLGGNSILIAGEAKSGQLKIKAPMGETTFAGLGCGDLEAISYNGNMRCYTDNAVYRGDANVPGSWRAACGGAGMLAGTAGTTMLKVNNTQPIVIGLCQGLVQGARIPAPGAPSVEFMRQGQRTAIIP